jgi:hypothetical protein
MSILVLIHIMNCKSCVFTALSPSPNVHQLSTETMSRKYSGYEVARHLDYYSCPQSCTPTRIRRRFAFKRLSVLHTTVNILCWIHLDANTFVSLSTNAYEDLLIIFHRNMFLNHFGKPSKYLPWCMVIWGIISVCTGATLFKTLKSQT